MQNSEETQEYNLLSEPWIPCLGLSGERKEVGIRDAIIKSADLIYLGHSSPLVTASIYRLLLAVVRHVYAVETLQDWYRLWQDGFDESPMDNYIKEWGHRFYLVGSARPFYQAGHLIPLEDDMQEGSAELPTQRIMLERNAGNNPIIWDDSTDGNPIVLSPAEAARYLVTYQSYHPGGTVGLPKRESKEKRSKNVSAQGGLSSYGITTLIEGANVHETLMLNTIIPSLYNGFWGINPRDDEPAWERDDLYYEERVPQGLTDHYTWQAMRVKLLPASTGTLAIDRVLISAGNRTPKGDYTLYDPLLLRYWQQKNEYWANIKYSLSHPLWRNAQALFADENNDDKTNYMSPLPVKQVKRLAEEGMVKKDQYRLASYGVCRDKSAIYYWQQAQHEVAGEMLETGKAFDIVDPLLVVAENTRRVLNKHIKKIGIKPDYFLEIYWRTLEEDFKDAFASFSGLSDPLSDPNKTKNLEPWKEKTKEVAKDIFLRTGESVEKKDLDKLVDRLLKEIDREQTRKF